MKASSAFRGSVASQETKKENDQAEAQALKCCGDANKPEIDIVTTLCEKICLLEAYSPESKARTPWTRKLTLKIRPLRAKSISASRPPKMGKCLLFLKGPKVLAIS